MFIIFSTIYFFDFFKPFKFVLGITNHSKSKFINFWLNSIRTQLKLLDLPIFYEYDQFSYNSLSGLLFPKSDIQPCQALDSGRKHRSQMFRWIPSRHVHRHRIIDRSLLNLLWGRGTLSWRWHGRNAQLLPPKINNWFRELKELPW